MSFFANLLSNALPLFKKMKKGLLIMAGGIATTSLVFNNCADQSMKLQGPAAESVLSEPEKPVCQFNGTAYTESQTVVAYQNSSVPFGQICQSENRVCVNGSFSGTFMFPSCSVGAPANCMFNGANVNHNAQVTAYANSTVPFGSTCMSQVRTCTNGVLSGNYAFASCTVNAPASCLFNGMTVAHNQSVNAFQNSSVPFGQTCLNETRSCNNGALSGTYAFASCSVDEPAACTFNGQTIANGQNVTAYQNSTVPYGSTCVSQVRSCANGVLSGSYAFGSCSVNAPASCLFNGLTVAHTQTVTAFQTSTVPFGSTCTSQTRTCNNGALSGTYSFGSCSVDAPASCLFNGQTIAHGQTVTGFQASSVPFGSTCTSQVRTCNNGTLSGTYAFASCNVNTPASCLFNGQTIAHGQTVTGFQASSVPFGSTCTSQVRTCNNGSLSGTYAYASCKVAAPANCTFGGQTVLHGQTVQGYPYQTVGYGSTCGSTTTLTCTNGSLGGTYYPTCSCKTGFVMVNGTCACASGKVYDSATQTCKTLLYRWKLTFDGNAMYTFKVSCPTGSVTYQPFNKPNFYNITTTTWPNPETLKSSTTAAANETIVLVQQFACGPLYKKTDVGGCVSEFKDCPTRRYQRESYY